MDGGHGGQPGGRGAQGGGTGGGVGGMLPVTRGEKLFVEVGSAGVYDGGAVFGGGGAGGAPPPVLGSQGGVYASSGGGASDVRTCSMFATSCPGGVSSAATRLLVGGGGGGASGGGNSSAVQCDQSGFGANANNFQYPPGNPVHGPVPIITAAGIVYPGLSTADGGSPGVTPAGGGSNVAGTGGSQAGCTFNGVTDYGSVAGKGRGRRGGRDRRRRKLAGTELRGGEFEHGLIEVDSDDGAVTGTSGEFLADVPAAAADVETACVRGYGDLVEQRVGVRGAHPSEHVEAILA